MTRAALLLAALLGLAACETTEGFLEDSQNAGATIARNT